MESLRLWLKCKDKKILLNIDLEDYKKLIENNLLDKLFALQKDGGYRSYIYMGNGTSTELSRWLMGCKKGDGKIVDHKNRNTMDNRRKNLRFVTKSQNASNCNSKRRYKGVYKTKSGKYVVEFVYKNKTKYIGTFDREIDAAKAWNKCAEKKYGEYAKLNIILD
jgi:hypothetical protein